MSSNMTNQTMALAGVFQAAGLVDQLAKTGAIESNLMSSAVDTILNLNPSSYDELFNENNNIRDGLRVLQDALAKNGTGVGREVLQYAMAIIAVQSKLEKRDDLMTELSKGLDRAVQQKKYFNDPMHQSVLASTASCYQNSISQLSFRIRVTGNPSHLQNTQVAEKVRTLLLFGVRCAFLWRQAGGRRWHFMVSRQKLLQQAAELRNVA